MAFSEPEIKREGPSAPSLPAGKAEAKGLSAGEVLRVLLIAGFIVGALVLLKATPLGKKLAYDNVDYIRQWLRQWGGWGWLVYCVVGMVLMSIGLPRLAFAAISGALYGVILGTILTQIANTLSAIPGFCYTRFLGRDLVVRKLSHRLQRLDGLLAHHGFMVVLLVRLCPVGNAFLTSCLFGVSAIRFSSYFLASSIGVLPENFILALLGGSFSGNFQIKLWSSIILLVLFSLFFIWYFKRSALAKDILNIMSSEEA